MNNPNPMNSRCGLADCDCGYTIEKLLTALEKLTAWVARAEGCDVPWPAALREADTLARTTIVEAKP